MKNILLITALLWALGASGQIYIDSYRFGGGAPPTTLLLDDYPNAAAAYSLRKLRTGYTGNCIVVRRSSNNDTLAIGFSGNYLDTATLKTFCASTNCFVRRWYDQSTNGRDGITVANTNQPQIVSSGAILLAGGLPSIVWDGSDDYFQVPNSGLNTGAALYSFEVYQTNNAAAANTNTMVTWTLGVANISSMLLGKASSTGILTNETFFLDTRRTSTGGGRAGSTTYTRAANTLVQETVEVLSNGFAMYQNSSAVNFNALSATSTSDNLTPNNSTYDSTLYLGIILIGTTPTLVQPPQRISELVFYNTNVSSNRTSIEANQQGFY